ncbi:TPA: hypothetical protein ACH3X2_006924 [Trebouxia sp. C0005]
MDPPDDEDDLPFSQLVAKQQDPVLPDHNFDLNTPTGSPEFAASYNKQQRRHGKMFNDPVHNLFRLDPLSIDIIDSAQFQRLRDLKQLGMTYYIFPGASHNRFEHSLGVAHLAFEVADKIWNSQRAELDMDRTDIKVVELAGLCHDLGHGPFSHVFDRTLLQSKGVYGWSHEEMSGEILQTIIDDGHIKDDALDDIDMKRVQQLIVGSCPNHQPAGNGAPPLNDKRFLFDIVANGRNSIDVDKFDYLARDSHYCNVKVSCDLNRLQRLTKVLDNEICFKWSEYENIFELFHARATMHRRVYTHRKAKAIELMLVDALIAADPVLKMTERIHDPREFVKMDDTLLKQIENYSMLHPHFEDGDDHAPVVASQKIITRLRKRQLYKYCSEVIIPPNVISANLWKVPSGQDVISCYSGPVHIKEEDVILCENSIDFAMKSQNPLDNVHFFDNFDSQDKYSMLKNTVSPMYPDIFQERKLRAYSRDGSPDHVDAVKHAFDRWVSKMWNDKVVTSTPLRPPHTLVKKAAVPAGQIDIPRQTLRQTAVHLSMDSSGSRMEKKRKIHLDSIPE